MNHPDIANHPAFPILARQDERLQNAIKRQGPYSRQGVTAFVTSPATVIFFKIFKIFQFPQPNIPFDNYIERRPYYSHSAVEDNLKLKEDRFPPKPERDVLLFLLKYTRLETWQQNILSMILGRQMNY